MCNGRKLFFVMGAAAALLGSAARPVRAQDRPPAGPPAARNQGPMTRGEIVQFEEFLERNPMIEVRLRQNPSLVNDPVFQKNHPQLAGFLARHPGVLAELAARRLWFIHRELVQWSASPLTPAQIAEFDRFLAQHPWIERQLSQHPQALRNPDFFNRSPELRDYLRQHPAIGRAAESRPDRPMQRDRRRENEASPQGAP
jgi:hypothetical protein